MAPTTWMVKLPTIQTYKSKWVQKTKSYASLSLTWEKTRSSWDTPGSPLSNPKYTEGRQHLKKSINQWSLPPFILMKKHWSQQFRLSKHTNWIKKHGNKSYMKKNLRSPCEKLPLLQN